MQFASPAARTALATLAMLAVSAMARGADDHHAIASGGGQIAAGDLRLSYTIGQAVAGSVGRDGVLLHGGFQALFVDASGDRIFRDGFDPPSP